MVQNLTFETGSVDSIEPFLAAAVRAMRIGYLYKTRSELIWQYPSEPTAYMMSFLGEPADANIGTYKLPGHGARRPTFYRSICRLTVFAKSKPYDEPIVDGDLVANAMTLIRAADTHAFEKETGEGPFAGCDGTVGIGYRLHGGGSYSTELLVSLCHIYHSK